MLFIVIRNAAKEQASILKKDQNDPSQVFAAAPDIDMRMDELKHARSFWSTWKSRLSSTRGLALSVLVLVSASTEASTSVLSHRVL